MTNSSTKLTEKVLRYQQTGQGLEQLIQIIAGIIYTYPRKYLGWDEDDASDFFCSYFHKINGLVNRFCYAGKPFEAYLSSSIRWQMKTFTARKAARNVQQQIIKYEYHGWYQSRHYAATELVAEGETTYLPEVTKILKINKDGIIRSKAYALRLIYLVLRSSMQVSDALLQKTAKLTGINEDRLLGCATELRQKLNKRLEKYGNLVNRRNKAHVRIQQLHGLLARETDSERSIRYMQELATERMRFAKIIGEIGTMSFMPTHKDIAEVLGVPKGTVDSGLYYLKNAFLKIGLN